MTSTLQLAEVSVNYALQEVWTNAKQYHLLQPTLPRQDLLWAAEDTMVNLEIIK